MESRDKHQPKSKIKSHALLELRVARRSHGGMCGFRFGTGPTRVRLIDSAEQRMSNHQQEKVGNIIAKASILCVGVVLVSFEAAEVSWSSVWGHEQRLP